MQIHRTVDCSQLHALHAVVGGIHRFIHDSRRHMTTHVVDCADNLRVPRSRCGLRPVDSKIGLVRRVRRRVRTSRAKRVAGISEAFTQCHRQVGIGGLPFNPSRCNSGENKTRIRPSPSVSSAVPINELRHGRHLMLSPERSRLYQPCCRAWRSRMNSPLVPAKSLPSTNQNAI